jgi:hypothetical protein
MPGVPNTKFSLCNESDNELLDRVDNIDTIGHTPFYSKTAERENIYLRFIKGRRIINWIEISHAGLSTANCFRYKGNVYCVDQEPRVIEAAKHMIKRGFISNIKPQCYTGTIQEFFRYNPYILSQKTFLNLDLCSFLGKDGATLTEVLNIFGQNAVKGSILIYWCAVRVWSYEEQISIISNSARMHNMKFVDSNKYCGHIDEYLRFPSDGVMAWYALKKI